MEKLEIVGNITPTLSPQELIEEGGRKAGFFHGHLGDYSKKFRRVSKRFRPSDRNPDGRKHGAPDSFLTNL
jgi:hypothetical protein